MWFFYYLHCSVLFSSKLTYFSLTEEEIVLFGFIWIVPSFIAVAVTCVLWFEENTDNIGQNTVVANKKTCSNFANIFATEDWIFMKFETYSHDKEGDHQNSFGKDLCKYTRAWSKNVCVNVKTHTLTSTPHAHMFLHKTLQNHVKLED